MVMMDRLRTAYVHAPSSLRTPCPQYWRPCRCATGMGELIQLIANILSAPGAIYDFVAKWRSERLQKLVQAAVRNAPHYQKVAALAGLDSASVDHFDVADLTRFPIITKSDVTGRSCDFLATSADQVDAVSTSGSSGVPLNLFLDKDRSAKEWAFVQDSWSKIGFQPRHTRAIFRGLHWDNIDRTPWRYEPALGELRLSPFHMTDAWMDKYCAMILRYGATYLNGYPSSISIFSNYVLRAGRTDVARTIAGVISMSEPLYNHQRLLIAEAFPMARTTSFYGMSEKVLFGSELSTDPSVIEMEPLYGIAEIVDDRGNTIDTPGERGRIVGTGLLFAGMPLIRYDTGDQAVLVEAASEKNFFRLRVKGLHFSQGTGVPCWQ